MRNEMHCQQEMYLTEHMVIGSHSGGFSISTHHTSPATDFNLYPAPWNRVPVENSAMVLQVKSFIVFARAFHWTKSCMHAYIHTYIYGYIYTFTYSCTHPIFVCLISTLTRDIFTFLRRVIIIIISSSSHHRHHFQHQVSSDERSSIITRIHNYSSNGFYKCWAYPTVGISERFWHCSHQQSHGTLLNRMEPCLLKTPVVSRVLK